MDRFKQRIFNIFDIYVCILNHISKHAKGIEKKLSDKYLRTVLDNIFAWDDTNLMQ